MIRKLKPTSLKAAKEIKEKEIVLLNRVGLIFHNYYFQFIIWKNNVNPVRSRGRLRVRPTSNGVNPVAHLVDIECQFLAA